MRMNRWLVLGFLLLAAGCSGAPVREGAVPAAPGEKVVELRAKSYSFTPPHLSVPADKPVVIRIHNEATLIPHSFVLVGPGGKVVVRQSLAKEGETLVRIAPMPAGTYVFYCDKSFLGSTHRGKGMEGKLEVLPEK